MKHIGILGGSFDPPHRGHIYISLEAKKMLSLDQVWWLVTPQNPLKITRPATYEERINDCYDIVKTHPILIKEFEKKINSKYSYYTIKYLCNHYSNIKFYWLMGADNLINFHKWHNWRKIPTLAKVVVFARPNFSIKALKSVASKKLSKKDWIYINFTKFNISSSKIKKI